LNGAHIEDLALRRTPDGPRPAPEIARHAALDTSVIAHRWTAVMKTLIRKFPVRRKNAGSSNQQ
jgi:hypothetical protein